ncbi:hypothetical protein I79_005196 [Cricetulus griseus]|uniref:Uncharacterized protein n=1 Tax=Cricetulus griseus TaxID=10029 RepID=G3H4J3_CRIGR|nr:hypothetical protein I79_005196 [Cricetulus griseus]
MAVSTVAKSGVKKAKKNKETSITCKITSNLESKSKLRRCKEQVGGCICAQKHPGTCLVSNR